MKEDLEVKEVKETVENTTPEFDYLAVSRDDYEKLVAGINILNDDMKNYMGVLLNNKFRIIPLENEKTQE